MCGCMARRKEIRWEEYHNHLTITPTQHTLDFGPYYNIKPQQKKPIVVTEKDGQYIASHMYWGIMSKFGKLMINARDDRLWTSAKGNYPSMWRKMATSTRCLIFADGFYEPEGSKEGNTKRKWHFFQLPDEATFAFGGLWTENTDPDTGEVIEGFVIITTDATDAMRPIHNRHPLMLKPEQWGHWLDHKNNNSETFLDEFMRPWDGHPLDHWRVSDRAKNWRNDDQQCVAKYKTQKTGSLFSESEA